mmetsp:Transcript_104097/g.294933  ORF Transcript_104097/g.294933 Transcript_104097/m.294933 type:complete len:242 (+) Transcript_104097:323-1048(+)
MQPEGRHLHQGLRRRVLRHTLRAAVSGRNRGRGLRSRHGPAPLVQRGPVRPEVPARVPARLRRPVRRQDRPLQRVRAGFHGARVQRDLLLRLRGVRARGQRALHGVPRRRARPAGRIPVQVRQGRVADRPQGRLPLRPPSRPPKGGRVRRGRAGGVPGEVQGGVQGGVQGQQEADLHRGRRGGGGRRQAAAASAHHAYGRARRGDRRGRLLLRRRRVFLTELRAVVAVMASPTGWHLHVAG